MTGSVPPPDAAEEGGGTATLAVSGVVVAFAVVSGALRFYTRIFTRSGLKWDDWLILAAVIVTLMTAALLLWGNAIDPIGIWVSDNTDPDYVYTEHDQFYLKLAFITSVLYFTISSTTKLGILLMYNRIFFVSRSFRVQLYVVSSLVVCFWIGCTAATLTNCIPLHWSWVNGLADPRYCFNYNIFWMAAGIGEIVLDMLILAMPISVVLRMTLSFRRKLVVGSIFFLGGFTIITGMVKVILGYRPGGRVPSYANTEVWATVHTGMEIVCANLPIFKPLVRRMARSPAMAKLSSLSPFRRTPKGPGQGSTDSGSRNDSSGPHDSAVRWSITVGGLGETDMVETRLQRPGAAVVADDVGPRPGPNKRSEMGMRPAEEFARLDTMV